MRHPSLWLTTFLFTALSFPGTGQVPTVQDCLGAVSVCQQVYSESLSFSGDGNIHNEINTSISCTAGELNSIWYTFTVDQSGDFGFLITPNDIDDLPAKIFSPIPAWWLVATRQGAAPATA